MVGQRHEQFNRKQVHDFVKQSAIVLLFIFSSQTALVKTLCKWRSDKNILSTKLQKLIFQEIPHHHDPPKDEVFVRPIHQQINRTHCLFQRASRKHEPRRI